MDRCLMAAQHVNVVSLYIYELYWIELICQVCFFRIPIKRTKQKINNVTAKADAKTQLTCMVIHFIESYTLTLP